MFTPDFLKKRAEFISSNSKYSSLFSEEQLAQLHEPQNAPESSQLKKDEDANQIPLYFLFNTTGNIMIASTTPNQNEIDKEVRTLFNKTNDPWYNKNQPKFYKEAATQIGQYFNKKGSFPRYGTASVTINGIPYKLNQR